MEAALNILRKTPPSELEKTLAGLETLAGTHDPETIDAIRQRLQLPFSVNTSDCDKSFLLCPYNKLRDGVYRSPWKNVGWPGNVKVQLSSAKEEEIRELEAAANEVWEAYTHLYYGLTAVGSVYLQKSDKGVFHGMFGIRKDCSTGSWNSAHLVSVDQPNSDQTECTYHIQSSVVLCLDTGASEVETNTVKISASVARKTTQTLKVTSLFMNSNHLENIGTIIEDVEIDIRSSFERVHIPRTQEMVDSIQKDFVKRGTQNMAMHNIMMGSDAFKKRREKAQTEG